MNKLTEISGVDNKIGRNSRTGSTVTITIPDDLIMDVSQYYMSVKANKQPTGRIKKIELIMYTEEDLKEVVELPSTEELDKAITLEDVIIEQDNETRGIDPYKELEALHVQFQNTFISEEHYKTKKEKLEKIIKELEKENLPANQRDLPLYKENILKCEKCFHCIDSGACNLECKYNPNSKSKIDLFEVIPMSQRL